MSDLKQKYTKLLDGKEQRCKTDDCIEDMVKDVFKITDLEESLAVVNRIFPDKEFDFDRGHLLVPSEKRKTINQLIGDENFSKIVDLIPQNTNFLIRKFVDTYGMNSQIQDPKARYKKVKEYMIKQFEGDSTFNPAFMKYITIPIINELKAQNTPETLEDAFKRHIAQNRPQKGDKTARTDYNKLKLTTKRVLAKLKKLSREKGGLKTDKDVEAVMGIIRGGQEENEEIDMPDVDNAVEKLIGVYPITDKLQLRLSNHPIDLFTVGEGQIWTKSACTSYRGCAPWDAHLSDDIKWNNVVAYLERQKDSKVYARASLRWCIIPIGDIESYTRKYDTIEKQLYKEFQDKIKKYQSDEHLLSDLMKELKRQFINAYFDIEGISSQNKVNFVIDPLNTYEYPTQTMDLMPITTYTRHLENFKDHLFENIGYISFGIEPIWYNIGLSNPQALKSKVDGGCDEEQRKMGMSDACLMSLNIAPKFTGYDATFALVNVIKSQGFQTAFKTCMTPYYFKGYSDEEGGTGHIDYETVSEMYGDGVQSEITLEDLFNHFQIYLIEKIKETTRCPNCKRIIEWRCNESFAGFMEQRDVVFPKYLAGQFYDTYLYAHAKVQLHINNALEDVYIWPYKEHAGVSDFGVERRHKCKFCLVRLEASDFGWFIDNDIGNKVDKYFGVDGLFRQKLLKKIKDNMLSMNPLFEFSWVKIDERKAVKYPLIERQSNNILHQKIKRIQIPSRENDNEDRLLKYITYFATELGIKRKKIVSIQMIQQNITKLIEGSKKVGVSRCPICEDIQGWTIQGIDDINDIVLDSDAYAVFKQQDMLKNRVQIYYGGQNQLFPIHDIKYLMNHEHGIFFARKCTNCGARIRRQNSEDLTDELIRRVSKYIWKKSHLEVLGDTKLKKEYELLTNAVISALFMYPSMYPVKMWNLWENDIKPDTTTLKGIFGMDSFIYPIGSIGEMEDITKKIADKLGIVKPLIVVVKKKFPPELEELLPIFPPTKINDEQFSNSEITEIYSLFANARDAINTLKHTETYSGPLVNAAIVKIQIYYELLRKYDDLKETEQVMIGENVESTESISTESPIEDLSVLGPHEFSPLPPTIFDEEVPELGDETESGLRFSYPSKLNQYLPLKEPFGMVEVVMHKKIEDKLRYMHRDDGYTDEFADMVEREIIEYNELVERRTARHIQNQPHNSELAFNPNYNPNPAGPTQTFEEIVMDSYGIAPKDLEDDDDDEGIGALFG